MNDSLVVLLDDEIAGTVTRQTNGRLRFDYDNEYQARPQPTPLSVSMPYQISSHPDRTISPWLWGLLPDNEAVLARWARHFHASASSAFSLLATPVGEDCAGAVRFASPEALDRVLSEGAAVDWLTDDQVGARLRELREDSTTWLGRTFTGQFSLAGAQAKTALLLKDDRWGVPSGSTPTTHILKPAVDGFDDHDLNEHLCLDAARRAGLSAARTRVATFAGESAVVVERYDRVPRGDQIVRVHQEDMGQALSVSPSRKYQNDRGPGPREIVSLLRRVMAPHAADGAVRGFVDALIWNWLIAGTDAHVKNYALLLAGDQVRLAPLYDIASALPYGTHEKKLRLAMKLGDDYRISLDQNNWPAVARALGVDGDSLMDRVRVLAAIAPDALLDAANASDVVSLNRAMPVRLADMIADRARRCRALIEASSNEP